MAQKQKPILIANGKLIDGTGNPWFYGDVLIEDGRITSIGVDLEKRLGQDKNGIEVIDAVGRYVTPGFIDIHSHSDIPLFIDGNGQSFIRQGVTTQIVGNCGGWSVPLRGATRNQARKNAERYGFQWDLPWTTLDEYAGVLTDRGVSLNVGVLVGHGAVRAAVTGYADRHLTEEELVKCEEYLEEALSQGAFGMSTGLYYAPGSYAPEEEIVRFSKVVRAYDGIHASHIRDEADYNIGLLGAIDEVIRIAEKSGVKTEVSHLKCLGPRVWGKSIEVLEKLFAARDRGIDITGDQYPYVASGSGVTGALMPRWAQEGSRETMVNRVKDPQTRAKIKVEMVENLARRGGAERLKINVYEPNPGLSGLSLAQAAERMNMDAAEAALTLLEKGEVSFVSFVIDEQDVINFMKTPFVMVSSDGWAFATEGPLSKGHPHPRSFGSFVRVMAKYALKDKVLKLEDAVRKMTSLPAARLGIPDRGYIKVGAKADVVVLNPETLDDRATFEEPKRYPAGIDEVIVNGVRVIVEGEHTGNRPGEVLKHK